VHWVVLDTSGNSNTCSQAVTILDTELPTLICTNSVITNADFGGCTISNIDLGTPVTADNCGVASLGSNVPALYFVGTTNVLWTAVDIHGNSNTCLQLVTIRDSELPTITCPANIVTNANPGACSITGIVLGEPVTSDNCGVASVTNDAPATFVVGTTIVTWTVVDLGGNTNTCTQSIEVLDVEPPSITCPSTAIVSADTGFCSAAGVALRTPVTSDNCDVASITNDAPATIPVEQTP